MACRKNIVLAIALTASVTIIPAAACAQSATPPAQQAADTPPPEKPPSPEPSLLDKVLRRHSGDLSPANEQADTQRPPPPGFAGDWFGLKPRFADAGIGLTGRYVSEAAWNYTGGRRRDITEAGQLDIGLLLDMRKLAGIDGTFQATITYRRGHQLDQRAGLGTLQEVQEIYGRGQTWMLTQFWYEQTILHGGIDMKLGRTSPGEDFAAFSCSFQNLSFCGSQPGNLVGNYWYNWPVSQWGGRFRAKRGKVYAQIAFYEENPRNLDPVFAIGHFSGATGVLIPVELGVARGGEDGRPVGSYKLGGWVSTANAADVFLDVDRRPIVLTDLPPLERSSAYGLWVNIQQQVTGRSAQGKSISGLTVFLNVTQADRRTSTIDNQIAVGLFEKGLFPWFTEDVLGLAFARTHVNGRIAQAERLAGEAVQHSEYAAELYYGFHPRNWLELRPNLQWAHHAGGYRNVREVGVIGLKTALTL